MPPYVDLELLLKQEPEFKEFVKETLFLMNTSQPQWSVIINMIHGMYQEGMKPHQIARIFRSVNP
jgi:hypothetical protein